MSSDPTTSGAGDPLAPDDLAPDALDPYEPEITEAYVEAAVAGQRWYWLLLLKTGPVEDFAEAQSEAIQMAHLRHLFSLQKRGQLTMFGPVRDTRPLRGIGILTVETRAEAEALMAEDPWIKAGGMIAEVRPFFTQAGARLPE